MKNRALFINVFLILNLLLLLLPFPLEAREILPVLKEENEVASLLDKHLENQIRELNLEGLDRYLRELEREVGMYLPPLGWRDIWERLRRGELPVKPEEVARGLARYFLRELWAGTKLLSQLVILAVAGAVLQNLQASLSEGTAAKVAHGVVFLALVGLALTPFTLALQAASQAIDRMVSFFQSLLPMLVTLLAATGGLTTSTLLQPVLTYSLTIAGTVTRGTIFPLIYLGAILGVVSHISDRFQISRLAGLLRQFSLALLGLMLTLFTGVLSVYGIGGSVADGLSLRAAEFATASFVPVVGKILSDAVTTVAGTTLLLKTAVGVTGVVIIFFLVAFPLLKIVSLALVYRVAAALVQPFGEHQLSDALEGMGGALLLLFACLIGVTLMFYLTIGVIVLLGNLLVALRG
ncbi:stage III sporulation protein AE [Thermanaeromonas toyohensis ToBE]|uniref:Stage III sporulation protein AE n=1 Tax=Thermanaeromonas toyohensis ToBE TaxID=698762 RepID=A0A1W1VZ10_9FIRM|nr:stage III sporulation protein AE [Thermanaeromonas toyohensis]SMB98588.1 stage III sporulation protein AE [Thermanaeromonas toyohensis ToBE]